ncbi:hypothetical protein RCG19_10685 [Neobacillus sp. OS1-2]|nr:hypothetical protein [Neobacillus sp. OS1-2]WML42042.1 hypothetical protein RCG19_10685 [Neobacillus sp. OS1-2]
MRKLKRSYLNEKKLGKALLKMSHEVNEEIERGEYITLDHLKENLEDED